jgi:hypothetical protein
MPAVERQNEQGTLPLYDYHAEGNTDFQKPSFPQSVAECGRYEAIEPYHLRVRVILRASLSE